MAQTKIGFWCSCVRVFVHADVCADVRVVALECVWLGVGLRACGVLMVEGCVFVRAWMSDCLLHATEGLFSEKGKERKEK